MRESETTNYLHFCVSSKGKKMCPFDLTTTEISVQCNFECENDGREQFFLRAPVECCIDRSGSDGNQNQTITVKENQQLNLNPMRRWRAIQQHSGSIADWLLHVMTFSMELSPWMMTFST